MMVDYTPENLKKKSIVARDFLHEKYGINISHSHSLELISRILGFKDWNTAVADLKKNTKKTILPTQIRTVGDMKKILEICDDSWVVDADYEYKSNEFGIDAPSQTGDEIYQEFSLSFEEFNENIVTFKLHLEHESVTSYWIP